MIIRFLIIFFLLLIPSNVFAEKTYYEENCPWGDVTIVSQKSGRYHFDCIKFNEKEKRFQVYNMKTNGDLELINFNVNHITDKIFVSQGELKISITPYIEKN